MLRLLLTASLGLLCACPPPNTTTKRAAAINQGILPAASPRPPSLVEALRRRREQLGPKYRPRTRHLRSDGEARFTNRLLLEDSPYLLQHAHNPVDWNAWGDEAFERAQAEGKLVLLSVGYSTCHWCHVMEEESFEDEEIAAEINAHYIAIKVDREERPDVDSVYMQAVRFLTGRGGWPMTVWLTPQREPIYGGTYFPPRDGARGGRTGFLTLLRQVREQAAASPDETQAKAVTLAARIRHTLESSTTPSDDAVDESIILSAAQSYSRRFDDENGGVRQRRKFPSSFPVRLLLRAFRRSGDETYRRQAMQTFDAMASGGLYDHVGGGFHRYTTDQRWRIPHFEKMLYDNAQLVVAYVEAWQLTDAPRYKRVVEETLAWVAREMTDGSGAFYSATDADSIGPDGHREEGYFFTWTPQEIRRVLNAKHAEWFVDHFGVSRRGNFEGRTVLHAVRSAEESAKRHGVDLTTWNTAMAESKKTLLDVRSQRPPPLRDDKVLTSWNGMMISAFVKAGIAFARPDWVAAGVRAADSLVERNVSDDGLLARTRLGDRLGPPGVLDDYANAAAAFLDIFEATADMKWLDQALRATRYIDRHFSAASGAYTLAADNTEALLATEIPSEDGAVPSGNSVHALNLLRLYELTTQPVFLDAARRLVRAFSSRLHSAPSAMATMLLAVDFLNDAPKTVAIVFPHEDGAAVPALVADLSKRVPLASRVLLAIDQRRTRTGDLVQSVPWLREKKALNGQPTIYVCRSGVCERPTVDVAAAAAAMTAPH